MRAVETRQGRVQGWEGGVVLWTVARSQLEGQGGSQWGEEGSS